MKKELVGYLIHPISTIYKIILHKIAQSTWNEFTHRALSLSLSLSLSGVSRALRPTRHNIGHFGHTNTTMRWCNSSEFWIFLQ